MVESEQNILDDWNNPDSEFQQFRSRHGVGLLTFRTVKDLYDYLLYQAWNHGKQERKDAVNVLQKEGVGKEVQRRHTQQHLDFTARIRRMKKNRLDSGEGIAYNGDISK